jgi:23S rRNA pseudouridine1911/1915/1917 synthase
MNKDTPPSGARHTETLSTVIPAEFAGQRLDQALAKLFTRHSRSRLAGWIKRGEVLVDAQPARPRDRVRGGERVQISARIEPLATWIAEPVPLEIIYQDEALLVINKPAGLVVHPGAGNPRRTLANALLDYDPALARLPRAGLVQRLDKDTTGLLVVARTLDAHTSVVQQLQERRVRREYLAVVNGLLTAGGRIEAAIGRHPRLRTRMAVVESGKPAVTHYRVIRRFRAHTFLRLRLETGRTHQIRVHMAHAGHPLLGDPVYGRLRLPRGAMPHVRAGLQAFRRQALHAGVLGLAHPATGIPMQWETPLPADFTDLLRLLEDDAGSHD